MALGDATAGTQPKVALEGYPALLAREFVAARSYKSDTVAKQSLGPGSGLIARMDIVHGLEIGGSRLGLRLKLSHAQRDALLQDASGDALDAVLCLVQAAWARQRFEQGDLSYGLPAEMDPLEGWIVTGLTRAAVGVATARDFQAVLVAMMSSTLTASWGNGKRCGQPGMVCISNWRRITAWRTAGSAGMSPM